MLRLIFYTKNTYDMYSNAVKFQPLMSYHFLKRLGERKISLDSQDLTKKANSLQNNIFGRVVSQTWQEFQSSSFGVWYTFCPLTNLHQINILPVCIFTFGQVEVTSTKSKMQKKNVFCSPQANLKKYLVNATNGYSVKHA